MLCGFPRVSWPISGGFSGDKVQADVHGAGGMGDGADGDEIDAGGGDGADGFQVHAAAGFGAGAAGNELYGAAQLGGGHVVEQDDIRARRGGLGDLGEGVRLHLDLEPGEFFARAGDGGGDGVGRFVVQGDEVIVLDEDHIVQAKPMILAAATGHGVFFEAPPAGRGFAGIENFCAGGVDGGHKRGGGGGHAGEALDKIQGDAFGAQEGAAGAGNFEERPAGGHVRAIAGERFDPDGG